MFETIRALIYCLAALLVVFIVCLALPHSKLRDFVMQICGWGVAAGSAVYVASPLDILPDVIPLVGWVDDAGAIVLAITAAMAAINAGKARKQLN